MADEKARNLRLAYLSTDGYGLVDSEDGWFNIYPPYKAETTEPISEAESGRMIMNETWDFMPNLTFDSWESLYTGARNILQPHRKPEVLDAACLIILARCSEQEIRGFLPKVLSDTKRINDGMAVLASFICSDVAQDNWELSRLIRDTMISLISKKQLDNMQVKRG